MCICKNCKGGHVLFHTVFSHVWRKKKQKTNSDYILTKVLFSSNRSVTLTYTNLNVIKVSVLLLR